VAEPGGKHRPRKRFGQNFLHDPGVIRRTVAAIQPLRGEHIVEIGPGLGALTLPLLQATGELDVIELDRDLIPKLTEYCAGHGVLRIHNADALRFDFAHLASDGRKLRIAGNLPYNISTPLLFHLLDQADCIQDMYFMLQKEVVERMISAPGGSDYGRLSVMLQYRCAMEKLFNVGPGAFSPAPKIESAVVRLTPYANLPVTIKDEARFAALVKQAFSQRRKTLRNTLRGMVTEEQMRAAGIDPNRRAETLSLEEYAVLSNVASTI
jgi:16S rRNA (adenine1518-N6/adenine1519-N6)-dimethyltransferase